jgi:hypothetical protein
LKELVDVGADDGDEAHPLEQGIARIRALLQHPPAEVEVGELAVEVQLGLRQIGLGDVVGDAGGARGPYRRVGSPGGAGAGGDRLVGGALAGRGGVGGDVFGLDQCRKHARDLV